MLGTFDIPSWDGAAYRKHLHYRGLQGQDGADEERHKWGIDAATSVESKGYFIRTLRNIAHAAHRSNVPDLHTALLLVNTQAVRRFVEAKNRYAQRRFITPDDWFQVQDLPVPSRQFELAEQAVARVNINQFEEISASAPILPISSPDPAPAPAPGCVVLDKLIAI